MEKRCEIAVKLAQEAGELTLRYFNRDDLGVERKSDGSPVTLADRGAEELVRRRVAEAFPEDAILGEEFDDKEGTSGYRWIVDPIDGTKSFITGVPLYSNLIGIEKDGEPVVGVLWLPALGRGIWAAKGRGAWRFGDVSEPTPARVDTTVDRLEDALFLTSDAFDFDKVGRDGAYDEIEKKVWLTRTWGDAYGYYLVAIGKAHIMIDPYFEIWDAAPLKTIMEEAGGFFGDWQGNATIRGREGVATNANLKDAVVEILRRYPKTKEPK